MYHVPTYAEKPYLVENKQKEFDIDFNIVSSKLRANRVCLDIGAHIGIYACNYASKFEQVHSFEPVPRLFELLEKNTQKFPNITTYNKAVSDNANPLVMYEHYRNTEINVIEHEETKNLLSARQFENIDRMNKISIKCIDIDSLNVTNIDFIKIDTEEYISPVIKGMLTTLKNNDPVIQIESCKESHSILSSLGYNKFNMRSYDSFYHKDIS